MIRLLPTLLLLGCSPDLGALEQVEVQRAWLQDSQLTSIALIGGGTWGTSTLVVQGQGGEWLESPVRLRGGMVGLVADFTREEPEIELELPEPAVTADQLLGRYTGSAEEVVIVAGVDIRHLHNEHEVGIDQASLAWGLGIMFAYEWLAVRLDGDPDLADDTGVSW